MGCSQSGDEGPILLFPDGLQCARRDAPGNATIKLLSNDLLFQESFQVQASTRAAPPAMKSGPVSPHRIELRVRQLAQLFNSMDPTPFLNRDLDPEAEAFIESWAQEFPPDGRFTITIHLTEPPQEADPGTLATESIHNFFRYKAEITRRQLRQLLRQGRVSLSIGIGFVVVCLLAADAVREVASGPFATILHESLIIVGWVAMWRPLQIFLYDWWPVAQRRRLYVSLGHAHVHVLQGR